MKKLRKVMLILFLLAVLSGLALVIFFNLPGFGRLPRGAALAEVEKSPHYLDGTFHNLVETPMLADRQGFISAMLEYLFTKKERLKPRDPVPTVKTDLKALDPQADLLIWLGHSSFYIQLSGARILIDPVLSDYAAPVSFANRAFSGTNLYTADDFPEIDYLLITHDHWDHLDYPTVMALKPKLKKIITGLGVGAHFQRWGFAPQLVQEADWNSRLDFDGLTIHLLPARHFSGRSLTRNKSLWAAFALGTDQRRIFFSGDSGYGPHFKQIGADFDGFDLVALDSGQYDQGWPFVHMTPEEAAQAALDLRAKALLPAHIGKFSIANHSWDDPFIRTVAAAENKDYRLLTPLIGQMMSLDESKNQNEEESYPRWWESRQ